MKRVLISECEVESIKYALASMYRGDTGALEAARSIDRNVVKDSLVAFMIDAFNRGWITRFHLGITEDGDVI